MSGSVHSSHLVRDEATGHLVNTNTGEYEAILAARRKRAVDRDLEARLVRLELLLDGLMKEKENFK